MGFIPEETVSQIIDRCDIVETIEGYVKLKRAGRNFKGLCPFHVEKTPSFVVNPDKQIFHCFGCGVGGNIVSFIMKQERIDFPEAIEILAQKTGVVIAYAKSDDKRDDLRQRIFEVNKLAVEFFHKNLLSDRSKATQKAREYLKARSINLEAVKKFKLGFALDSWDSLFQYLRSQKVDGALMEKAGLIIIKEDKNSCYDRFRDRIIFPIFDIKNKCLGFGARTLEADATAKYINSPESAVYTKGQHLYGFHLAKEAIAKEDFAIVVEGYMDFITPFQAGVCNIVASLGTALTVEQIRLLKRYTDNVVMLFDTDKAGESAMIRSLDLLIEEGINVKVATLTPKDDPDSFVRAKGAEAFRRRIKEAKFLIDYKLDILIKNFNPQTMVEKLEILRNIFPTINKIPNSIIQSQSFHQAAARLNISEQVVIDEYNKYKIDSAQGKKSYSISQSLNERSLQNICRGVEYELIKLMLLDETLIAPTKALLTASDFKDNITRQIVTKIFDLLDSQQSISVAELLNYFDDVSVQQIISYLTLEAENITIDKKRMHKDCINRLMADQLKSKRKQLLQQMELAETKKDFDKLEELKQKFNQLIKR